MGYLDNSSITVHAILTKKGRELLSKGSDQFNITQFALSDDEVDYRLWNSAHPSGTDHYGAAIENLPMLEPTTDENFMMKYKLLSLPKNTIRIPKLMVVPTTVTLSESATVGQAIQILTMHNTSDLLVGYTVTLVNSAAANLIGDGAGIGVATDPVGANEDNRSITITCQNSFTIIPKILPDNIDISTKIIVFGNESGARYEIPLTITNDPNTIVGSTFSGQPQSGF